MKYNFNEKRRRVLLDFYDNPNQTLKQLAARHKTSMTNVSKTLTEFFRLSQDRAALIKQI